jgi:hypothetical protein
VVLQELVVLELALLEVGLWELVVDSVEVVASCPVEAEMQQFEQFVPELELRVRLLLPFWLRVWPVSLPFEVSFVQRWIGHLCLVVLRRCLSQVVLLNSLCSLLWSVQVHGPVRLASLYKREIFDSGTLLTSRPHVYSSKSRDLVDDDWHNHSESNNSKSDDGLKAKPHRGSALGRTT